MTITITQLYAALAEKLGKEEAESLTTYIEEKITTQLQDVATKEFVKLTVKAEVKGAVNTILLALIPLILGLYAVLFFRH